MEKSDMISVVIGSKSDSEVMLESCNVLKDFGLAYELRLFSFHRNPEEVLEFGRRARERGIKVIIASIGTEKHLAGILASLTTVPIIGVPILSVGLDGTDTLFSTIQVSSGVPVATTSIGRVGAKNAALLAIEILAVNDEKLSQRLIKARKKMYAEYDMYGDEIDEVTD